MTQDEFLSKPLPSSDDAERIVLGSILITEQFFDIARGILAPSDFYNPLYKTMFDAMVGLYAEAIPIDPVAMSEWWKSHKVTIDPGVTGVSQLLNGMPLIQEKEFERNCTIIKKHSVARRLLFLTNAVQRDILEGEEDITEITKRFESHITTINNGSLGGTTNDKAFTPIIEIIDPLARQLAAYNRGESSGVKTGMHELDEKLDGGGLQANASYLIAAGEKVGKTSLVLGWAYEIAYGQGFTVPYITLEMSKLTLTKRLFSLHTGIPFWRFRPGLDGKLYEQAIESLEEFSKIPIKIADQLFGMTQIAHYLRREVEQGHKKRKPVGAAFIDYVQIINSDMGSASTREREVANVSRGIKQLSSELGIPLVILSSINRVGLSEGQEPDASLNLRDSGTLAFDAEAVMLLHNPAYVPGKPYEQREVTDILFNLARQRNGPTGRIKLKFIGKFMQFMSEGQYIKHFGDPTADQPDPKSTGQLILEQKKSEAVWDEKEEEADGWPIDE